MPETSKGVALIAKERESQRQEYSDEHDDRHGGGQIALAAALLATPILLRSLHLAANTVTFRDPYPWPYSSRPHDGNVVLPNEVLERPARVRQLVKAGALVAAEIDRLLRLEAREDRSRKCLKLLIIVWSTGILLHITENVLPCVS